MKTCENQNSGNIYARRADEPTDDRVWKSNWGRVVQPSHPPIPISRYSHIEIFTMIKIFLHSYFKILISIHSYTDHQYILHLSSRYSQIKISYPISYILYQDIKMGQLQPSTPPSTPLSISRFPPFPPFWSQTTHPLTFIYASSLNPFVPASSDNILTQCAINSKTTEILLTLSTHIVALHGHGLLFVLTFACLFVWSCLKGGDRLSLEPDIRRPLKNLSPSFPP